MIDLEFIERCMGEEFQEVVEKYYNDCIQNRRDRWNKWMKYNPEKIKNHFVKYFSTEKGMYAVTKRNSTRRNKFKSACEDLSWEEKRNIGRFYKNCPEGYEVDHIIPVSRGGKHRLSNLQYLTKEENRKKSAKILHV